MDKSTTRNKTDNPQYLDIYTKYLNQGYYSWWAAHKASIEIEVLEKSHINTSIMVMIPGIGDCRYTGD